MICTILIHCFALICAFQAKALLAKEDEGIQMKSIDGTSNGHSGKEVVTKPEKDEPFKLPLHITFWNALKSKCSL